MLNRFFSANLFANLEITGNHLLIVVAALACLLGAEIACIWILCSKVKKARMDKLRRDEESNQNSFRHYGITGVMLLGAIPQATYIALIVLSVLCALAALVFVILVIVFQAKGYEFASLGKLREESEGGKQTDSPAVETKQEASVLSAEDAEPLSAFDATEEQRQDAYTDTEESAVEEIEQPEAEAVEDIETSEDAPAEQAIAAVESQSVAPAYGTPVFADGSKPYKVVEKTVTETYKEVVKETQVPSPTPQGGTGSAATDAFLEKLTDLLDLEIQKRKSDLSDEDEEDKSVSTMAHAEDAENASDEDEDEDEDEPDEAEDTDDAEDAKGEDDKDDEASDNDDRFTGNERIIGFDEETGCYIVAHYRKSFEAKLIQARPNIKHYYSELKNALLSYKGTKNRISWTADSFHNGRTPIAKINVKTRILELYLALDPASLEGTVYRGHNVGDKKKYADTPFRYKIRTPRKFNWAMELVQRTCEEHGLSPIDIEKVNYEEQYPFDTTDNLVQRKLIKEYIREEKPATSFELDPDHVTQVPEEDSSVIPANANFSWEFDNDVLAEQEEEPVDEEVIAEDPPAEPIEESVEEPAIEEAPTEEPAPTATTVVEKETVKVTEVHYTERYYADAAPVYEQYITSTEPIEAEAIPADAEVETVNAEEAPVETVAEEVTEDTLAQEESQEEVQEEIQEEIQEDVQDEIQEEAQEDSFEDLEENTFSADKFGDADPFAAYRDTDDEKEEYTEEEYAEEEYAEVADEDEESESVSYDADEDAYWTDGEDLDASDDSEADEAYEEESHAEDEEVYEEESYAEDEEVYDEESYAEDEEVYEEESYEGEEEVYEEESYEGEEEAYEEAEEAYEEEVEEVHPPVRATTPANPSVAVVDISTAEEYFDEGDTVSLETLKEKGLVLPAATVLKLYASGDMTKRLVVEAHHFTLDAIKAISDADGDTVMIR